MGVRYRWDQLLLAIGIWRHGVQRAPIRYDPQYWSLVFPLGMFAASTFRMGAAIDVGLPAAVAGVAFWIAVAAWLVTAIGMTVSFIGRRGRAP